MKDKSPKSMDEIKWSEFKQACLDLGFRQFDSIGSAWQEFKDMREGKTYLFGDHMLPDEYWRCELRYDFMDLVFAKEILKELNVPEPNPLPLLNKDKLYAYWYANMEKTKNEYYETHPSASWSDKHYLRHYVQKKFNKDELELITGDE